MSTDKEPSEQEVLAELQRKYFGNHPTTGAQLTEARSQKGYGAPSSVVAVQDRSFATENGGSEKCFD